MNRKQLPRPLVRIGIGLTVLAIAYLLLFSLIPKILALVLLCLGVPMGLYAESFRRRFDRIHHDYYIIKSQRLTVRRPDGKTITLNRYDYEEEKLAKKVMMRYMQAYVQAAFELFFLGTVFSLVGFVTASLEGTVFWVALVIVLLPIAWNALELLIWPISWGGSLRGEYFGLLFGRRVADPFPELDR